MPTEDDFQFEEDVNFDDKSPDRPHGVRFGEDQPINRMGRPKGSANRATMVKRVANKRHRAMVDGKIRRKTNIELVVLAVRKKMATGDMKAFQLCEKIVRSSNRSNLRPCGVLISGEELTADEWVSIFDHSIPDSYVEKKYPYLMMRRREDAAYHAMIQKQIEENEAAYERQRAARIEEL